MQEFYIVEGAMTLLERASGCQLHRDPFSDKCKFLPLAKWRGTLKQEDIPFPFMTISDHLEMVGVELRATWAQTRKVNGDIIQSRVGNTIKRWKSGKYMQLSMRGWSLNTYCLSKVWFWTHSVDIRVMDIKKIASDIKSWLYADMLLKPEEMVMHRPVTYGGLGVHHVQCKAMAGLIRSFLEIACHPQFRRSLYHSLLYRYHVLGDTTVPDPGIPPFYSKSFFSSIRKIYKQFNLNVAVMSEKQWYEVLLEDKMFKEEVNEEPRQYLECRVELLSVDSAWGTTWRLARLPGLGLDNTSFLFKMIHQILLTQERGSKTNPSASPLCKSQGCALCRDGSRGPQALPAVCQ